MVGSAVVDVSAFIWFFRGSEKKGQVSGIFEKEPLKYHSTLLPT